MAKSLQERAKNAKNFAEYWKDKGNEKQESQTFWYSLLSEVFEIEQPKDILRFEEPVKLSHTSYKDVWIIPTRVLIEQKGAKIDLYKKEKQSDGTELTPYEQAKRYDDQSPFDKKARWIIVCNFHTFLIYDMNKEQPEKSPIEIKLQDLDKEYKNLLFLVDNVKNFIRREEDVSVKAGQIVGKLYDALIKLYHHPENPDTLKSLNILCVRIVFCLYAEDSGLFGKTDAFHDYLAEFPSKKARKALIELFNVLDTDYKDRDEYLDEELASFPYVNGGLFAKKDVEIPQFNDEVLQLILEEASEKFNWKDISPTIFGAVFESTLNPETRRKGGMHYTSLKNIHKVIDPLFLDELENEYNNIISTRPVHTTNAKVSMKEKEKRRLTNKADREYMDKMIALQEKLSQLTFFDPACGSGNFLTETYISIRHLENKIIKETALYGGGSQLLAFDEEEYNPIKVSISQFYGIEINDFAVTVAKTALWIAESQMMEETVYIINRDLDFFPLTTNANIHEGNALRMDWNEVIEPSKCSYIMGNPPFVGGMMMSREQKSDMVSVWGKIKGVGELDYVSAWYRKAFDYTRGFPIQTAFVSTNSIVQGQQAVTMWKPLISDGLNIHFAYRTFRWDSESNEKARVHCVIIGFSTKDNAQKQLFVENKVQVVNHINSYLLDAPTIFVESRNKPLCNVPPMRFGNMPRDGGGFILTEKEKNDIISAYPNSSKWIRLYLGSREFINGGKRWCLWMKNADPSELKKCKPIMDRINLVRDFRLASKAAATRKFAETPTLFCQIAQTDENYIVIPEVSSERRKYIPMGFLSASVIASNLLFIIPGGKLYHFGILISNVHMAWMRVVAGRLEMRYRYSKDIVYNNFPWPTPNEKQIVAIEQTAQGILDARNLYPDCSLADLYDPLSMPPELLKAHKANDKAVMQAYGFWGKFTSKDQEENELACVAELMKMYQKLCEGAE